jgi:hypothetical protein
MVMDFSNMPGPGIEDDGLVDNPCWPKELIDDPGFACTSSRSFIANALQCSGTIHGTPSITATR